MKMAHVEGIGIIYSYYPEQTCLQSEITTVLLKITPDDTVREIVDIACKNLSQTLENLELKDIEHALLLRDNSGYATTYITDNNRYLIEKEISYLVEIPTVASKQLIERISSQHARLSASESPFDYQALINLLSDLEKMLSCPQFAIEYIKQAGHDLIFRLTESFGIQSENESPTDNTPSKQMWSKLIACLVQLSEYGVRHSHKVAACGEEEKGEDETTVEDHENSIRDCNSECGGNAVLDRTESKKSLEGDYGTLIPSVIDPPESESLEVFSWHIIPDKFLDSIVQQCNLETRPTELHYGLQVIQTILNYGPIESHELLHTISPDFIADQLDKISKFPQFIPAAPSDTDSINSTISRAHLLVPTNSNISLQSTASNSWCGSVGGGSKSSIVTLLDILCTILRQAKSTSNDFISTWRAYLNHENLSKLLFSFLPQQSHLLWDSVDRPSPILFDATMDWKDTLVRHSSDLIEPVTMNGSRYRKHNSFSSGQMPTIFAPEYALQSPGGHLRTAPARHLLRNNDRMHDWDVDIVSALSQILSVQLLWMQELLKSAVDEESPMLCDHMSILHEIVKGTIVPSRPENEVLDSTAMWRLIGAQFPGKPHLDYCSPPGQLGLYFLKILFLHEPSLIKQILNADDSSLHPEDVNSHPVARSQSFVLNSKITSRSPAWKFGSFSWSTSDARYRRRTIDGVEYSKCNSPTISQVGGIFESPTVAFPLVRVVNALTLMLCELLGFQNPPPVPDRHYGICLQTPLYPFLFQPRTPKRSSLEELFLSVFSVFFYMWSEYKADPEDMDNVLSVLREQVKQILHRGPQSFDDFEQQLTRFTPQSVRNMWAEQEEKKRHNLIEKHPMLKKLKSHLADSHTARVDAQRLVLLERCCPLEYISPKNQRQQTGLNVVLSRDHRSLIVQDTSHCIRESWPLSFITRVNTGVEEKVKKDKERSFVIHVRIDGESEKVQVVAASSRDYKHWIDGFYVLRLISAPTEKYIKDIQSLVDLDMRIRLCGVNIELIPTKPRPLPPNPPDFDFHDDWF